MSTTPAFANVGEAMDMARAALGYLADADAAQLAAETQAECRGNPERTDAIATAARASFLSAFTAGKGLLRRRGLQRDSLADAPDRHHPRRRRLAYRVGQAGQGASEGGGGAGRPGTCRSPMPRVICHWTDTLPEKFREESDELLVAAAAEGLELADLSALFAEMYERARGDLGRTEDPARGFA